MTDYLLDTNHLSPLVTPNHDLRRRVLERPRHEDTFAIAVPALTEMLYGIRMTPRAESNIAEWDKFKEAFTYYRIDREDAQQAADLQVLLRRRGWQLGTVDALIATVALRNNLVLLTTDRDYGAITGLVTENWLK